MVSTTKVEDVKMDRWANFEHWGWGRYPRVESLTARPERLKELQSCLNDRNDEPLITFGNGRSYGDAALIRNGRVILTRRLDRLLAIRPANGLA